MFLVFTKSRRNGCAFISSKAVEEYSVIWGSSLRDVFVCFPIKWKSWVLNKNFINVVRWYFSNLCFKRESSSDFHFEDPVSFSYIAALHFMLILCTISHLVLKISEVKVSSKHARSSKFHALRLLHKTGSFSFIKTCSAISGILLCFCHHETMPLL